MTRGRDDVPLLPAYLDDERTVKCGLPAEVRCRFTLRSTDGPLESAMIRCPAGHRFNGTIESLTWDSANKHNPGTAADSAVSDRTRRFAPTGDPATGSGRARPRRAAGIRRGTGARRAGRQPVAAVSVSVPLGPGLLRPEAGSFSPDRAACPHRGVGGVTAAKPGPQYPRGYAWNHHTSVRSTHVQPSCLRPLQEDHLDGLRPACGAGPRRGPAREPLHLSARTSHHGGQAASAWH